MQNEQWIAVSPAVTQAEQEAFRQLRQAMPDGPIHRAWSNFMFSAGSGHCVECDALVMGPGGLYLIEVKSLVGRLIAAGNNDWVQLRRGVPPRYFTNALHSTSMKARKLKELLRGPLRGEVPFIHAAVYFSLPNLTIDFAKDGLYGRPAGLGDIARLFDAEPERERDRITAVRARQIAAALSTAGIAESPSNHHVGMWKLERKPLAVADTWQDHEASHLEVTHEHRRIRLYLVDRQATVEQRASVERAAVREYAALSGIDHPGIVRVDNLEHHAIGPALVYRHDPRSMRLDQYLSAYGDQLPMPARVGLVRQIAEAMAYAHGRRLFHRSLSARSVLVVPGKGDDGWLEPRLEVTDWHLASRRHEDESLASVHPTAHLTLHASGVDDCYLAPEWRLRDADPVALDVFGVGALAYALLTAVPPATSHEEIMRLVATGNGLCPSRALADVPPFADLIVQEATRPLPADRLRSVEDLLELFNGLEREVGRADVHVDPLQARADDVVGEWVIQEALGAGSVARVYLGRRGEDTLEVLKVARSEEQVPLLELEASVLRKLRTDSHVIGLVRPDVIDLGGRATLVLEYVGRETLARRLRNHGPLPADELESFGDQLIGALAFLEGEAVHHRDVKPDNIVLRVRPNGRTAPVLFDFSLSGTADDRLDVGTTGYLDPFLGPPHRPRYDHYADWFALAVTLHEMATGRLPVWGDGRTAATLVSEPPTLATEKFPVAGMPGFFHRALARSVTDRFATLTDMRLAWLALFRPAVTSPVTVPPAPPPVAAAPTPVAAPPKAKASKGTAPAAAPAKGKTSKGTAPAAGGTAPAPERTAPTAPAAPAVPAARAKTAAPATRTPGVEPDGVSAKELRHIREALDAALAAGGHVPLTAIGEQIKMVAPRVRESKYAGARTLTAFLARHLPEYPIVDGRVTRIPTTSRTRTHHQQKPFVRTPLVIFGRDGRTLISSGRDRSVHVWDLATDRLVHTLTGHGDILAHMCLDPAGAVLATASYDKTVRLWSLRDGRLLRTLAGVGARWLAFSPDGATLATAAKETSVRLWRVSTGQQVARLAGHTGDVLRMGFTHDGARLLTTARDGTMRVWQTGSQRTVHTVEPVISPRHAAYSSRGGWIAVAQASGTIRLYTLASGHRTGELAGHSSPVRQLVAAGGGTKLASIGEDGVLRLWDPAGRRQLLEISQYTRSVHRLIPGPDNLLATIDDDGMVRVRDALTGAVLREISDGSRVPPWFAFGPDGRYAATGSHDGVVRVCELGSSSPPVPVGTSSRVAARPAVPAPRAEAPAEESPSWIGRLLRRSG